MSSGPDRARRVVIGVGNLDRGDDGVGRVVAAAVQGLLSDDVRIEQQSGSAADLIETLRHADEAVLVDAMVSGAAPGTILRLDCAAGDTLPPTAAASSHGLGVAEAIALARVLGYLPRRCLVFAVEGVYFEPGTGLSPPVATAVAEVARLVWASLA